MNVPTHLHHGRGLAGPPWELLPQHLAEDVHLGFFLCVVPARGHVPWASWLRDTVYHTRLVYCSGQGKSLPLAHATDDGVSSHDESCHSHDERGVESDMTHARTFSCISAAVGLGAFGSLPPRRLYRVPAACPPPRT